MVPVLGHELVTAKWVVSTWRLDEWLGSRHNGSNREKLHQPWI